MSKNKEVNTVGDPVLTHAGPWTIAEVSDGKIKGFGASRKSKLDKYNRILGIEIALGRAKKDLYNKQNNVRLRYQNPFVG